MEAIIQRIKELKLPLDMMSNEQDRRRILHLAAAQRSMGVEAAKALQYAREGLLWEISNRALPEERGGLRCHPKRPKVAGTVIKACYDLYKNAK